SFVFFSLIAPPTTQIYTLSLHDALPISQRDLVEPRDGGVDDAEAIFAALHLEVGFVEAVDHDRVAQEAIGLEDVECELAMGVPGLVRDHEVDVVIEISPRLGCATRQSEVDAVVDRLVATILGAVEVLHPGQALV